MAKETQTGALSQPRGVGWGGRWEGGSKGRGYVYIYDGSWWRGLTECGPLEKGMANHFSILALRTP